MVAYGTGKVRLQYVTGCNKSTISAEMHGVSKAHIQKYCKSTVKYGKRIVLYGPFLVPTVFTIYRLKTELVKTEFNKI